MLNYKIVMGGFNYILIAMKFVPAKIKPCTMKCLKSSLIPGILLVLKDMFLLLRLERLQFMLMNLYC